MIPVGVSQQIHVQQLDFFCIECNFLRSTQLFLGLFALHSPSSTVLRLGGPLENSDRLINEGSVNKYQWHWNV
jgi:hypothetical protein